MFRLTDWLFLALNYWLHGGVRYPFLENILFSGKGRRYVMYSHRIVN